MKNKINVTILGSGSFGTALACAIPNKHLHVCLWGKSTKTLDEIQKYRINKDYLPNIHIPEKVKIVYDLKEAVMNADIILFVIPSQNIKTLAEDIKPFIKSSTLIANLAKGIDLSTNERLSVVVNRILPNNPFVVISGPSHAEELALKYPTSVVAASQDMKDATFLQHSIANEFFRIYTSEDILGVEYGGILKNIIALAGGISDGLGYGSNTKALLLTRGLVEMARFGSYFGAQLSTFYGLSGMGDLIVTATSVLSRNWTFGNKIGQGKSVEEAFAEMSMVVEGINAAKATYELSQKYGIEMPITEAVYNIIYNHRCPKKAVIDLMTRDKKPEIID